MRIAATMLMIIAVIATMRTILVLAITAIIMTMRMSVVDRRSRYSFGVSGCSHGLTQQSCHGCLALKTLADSAEKWRM